MFFIVTSLISSIMMGAGDFYGGQAARRSPVALVGLIGQAIGLVVVALISVIGAHPFSQHSFLIGCFAGVCGSVALLSLYRGLAVGRVAIVAPLSAVLGALLPVLVSLLSGQSFDALKSIGIASGLVAVYLLSLPGAAESVEIRETGLWHAIIAGVGLAGFYMLLGNPDTHGSIWTLTGERCSVVSIMFLVALMRRQISSPIEKSALVLIVVAGICDILGNLSFLYSASCGPLPIVALITSLYPGTTLLLGWTVLREPLNCRLGAGIAFAFICISLFAMP